MKSDDENETGKEFFAQNGAKLLLCARQWTRTSADAEDVLQEAFLRYWRHQRHLPGNPMALIITSIRRAAYDLARRDSRRAAREQISFLENETVTWFEPSDAAETQLLQKAVERLPEEQRRVVALKIWGELTFAQIAEQLDCSQNTVASRYRYALARLKEILTEQTTTAVCHA